LQLQKDELAEQTAELERQLEDARESLHSSSASSSMSKRVCSASSGARPVVHPRSRVKTDFDAEVGAMHGCTPAASSRGSPRPSHSSQHDSYIHMRKMKALLTVMRKQDQTLRAFVEEMPSLQQRLSLAARRYQRLEHELHDQQEHHQRLEHMLKANSARRLVEMQRLELPASESQAERADLLEQHPTGDSVGCLQRQASANESPVRSPMRTPRSSLAPSRDSSAPRRRRSRRLSSATVSSSGFRVPSVESLPSPALSRLCSAKISGTRAASVEVASHTGLHAASVELPPSPAQSSIGSVSVTRSSFDSASVHDVYAAVPAASLAAQRIVLDPTAQVRISVSPHLVSWR
jgi:hypothetical protein